MADRDPHGFDHPLEEWTDSELLDQLRYVRAEFTDMDTGSDDAGPEAALVEEIRRRGLEVPQGEDLDTPGRADRR